MQACTTYGKRAKCGSRKLFIWPAKPKILHIELAYSIKTTFKTFKFWPLNMKTKFFLAFHEIWVAHPCPNVCLKETCKDSLKINRSISPTFQSNFCADFLAPGARKSCSKKLVKYGDGAINLVIDKWKPNKKNTLLRVESTKFHLHFKVFVPISLHLKHKKAA